MSSKSYARKAEKFSISNPDASATDGQRNQIGRLLRFKDHNVEFGNLMVEVLDAPGFTRGEADRAIKILAKCPNVKKAQPTKAEVVQTTDAVIAQMARDGKLGKIAQRRALAIA